MKFKLTQTSNTDEVVEIEISTLEQLMELYDDRGEIIIRREGGRFTEDASPLIEIYDYYRE